MYKQIRESGSISSQISLVKEGIKEQRFGRRRARGHILLRKEPGTRHVARRICLEGLKGVFLGGSYLGSRGADLVP